MKKRATPILDRLEGGPWPSFVSGKKHLRDQHPHGRINEMTNDLPGQLEHSYETRKGFCKSGTVSVYGHGGSVIPRFSEAAEDCLPFKFKVLGYPKRLRELDRTRGFCRHRHLARRYEGRSRASADLCRQKRRTPRIGSGSTIGSIASAGRAFSNSQNYRSRNSTSITGGGAERV